MDAIMEISVAHGQPLLLYSELVRTKETAFFFTLLISSFMRYKHSPTSGSQMII